jgi:hypothetical protein
MLNTTDKIIKHKTGLLNLAEELGNVSKACQVMGMSRYTFYRYKSAVEDGGVEALFECTRRKPNLANRVDGATEDAVIKNATDFPACGQARTSNELHKLGVFVSPSGVRSIWLRHDLASFKARLKAPEAKVAEDGGILTEAHVQALEKKKQEDEAGGEVETAHPGFDEHDVPVLRIMTDRGTEYCGRLDKHDFLWFLAINDINHTRKKVKILQTNGICKRFHKTILQQFYQITFRKKL